MDNVASPPASMEEQPSDCAVDLEPRSPAAAPMVVLFSPLLPLSARFRFSCKNQIFFLAINKFIYVRVLCCRSTRMRRGEDTWIHY
jgi:hypothetical protein